MTAARRALRLPILLPVWLVLSGSAGQLSESLPVDRIETAGAATVRARAAAMLLSGQEGGLLPMNVLAVPVSGSGQRTTVAVLVEVDGSALFLETEPGTVAIEAFVYCLDEERGVTAADTRRFIVDQAVDINAVEGDGLKIVSVLSLPPGEHLVRVLVQAENGLFGLRGQRLQVPMPSRRAPLPAPLLVPEPVARWSVSLEPSPGSTSTEVYPFVLAGVTVLPACRPQLVSATVASGYVLFDPEEVDSSTLTAELRPRSGGKSVRLPLPLVDRLPTRWPELEAAKVAVEVASVDPGSYDLVVTAADSSGGSISSPPIVISVAADTRSGVAPRPIGEDQSGLADPIDSIGTEVYDEDQIRRRYRRSLEVLVAGEPERAMNALVQLESAAASASDQGIGVLESAERSALDDLVEESGVVTLPVALLHADTARHYSRRGLGALAGHAVRMTVENADLRARRSNDSRATRGGARVLNLVAGSALRHGSVSVAEDLLTRSLGLDPEGPQALLLLAAIQEKRGEYGQAVQLLKRLMKIDSQHAEGRLRLAINLARIGSSKAASVVLRELADHPDPAWISMLAHEEIARLELGAERFDDAIETLEQGLARWPGNRRLQTQLIYALDQGGDAMAARALVATLDLAALENEESERHRYNRWPQIDLIEVRRSLGETSSSYYGELAHRLARQPEAGSR